MKKKQIKVFISFDYEHDKDIRNSLQQQMYNQESLRFLDCSIHKPIDEKWKREARKKIENCDLVIFLCGRNTSTTSGVTAEMSIVQELKKPYILLKGRKKIKVEKPRNSLKSDIIIPWKWKRIVKEINKIFFASI